MNIGIYDPYLDDLGGGEKYMITLAECLSQNNSVTVFWDKPEDLKKVAERFSLDVSRIKVKDNIFSPFAKPAAFAIANLSANLLEGFHRVFCNRQSAIRNSAFSHPFQSQALLVLKTLF